MSSETELRRMLDCSIRIGERYAATMVDQALAIRDLRTGLKLALVELSAGLTDRARMTLQDTLNLDSDKQINYPECLDETTTKS